MSVSEFTITLHNNNNSAQRSGAEKSTPTVQGRQRELFRDWYGKCIIAIITAFTALLTFIYSVFSIDKIEYLPSAIILMVTLWIISELLERGKDNG